MAFAEDLTVLFADFGEAVLVNGTAAVGIFNTSTDLAQSAVLADGPSLELPATVAAAEGQTVVVRSVNYRVRQVLDQPPDGRLRTLVLAQV